MTLPKIKPSTLIEAPEGDSRGPYGYGRASHGSDPAATYQFAPAETMLPTTTAERVFHPRAEGDEVEGAGKVEGSPQSVGQDPVGLEPGARSNA